ncbi:Na(+)/H(+) antiporter subunit F1 [Alkalibacillus salilacus]|uniref:Multicomponent Na+:H+ antiporter subunit F n=1 Tax=Alkalibacillus salilacus TaxID=284582 RepID=A0ABT9VCP6_9BACI|nr:Na(+)/H(+) antiporter subunit F1 [Alkalibacillus salilacus]MDQ0158702.1 multicomponent Na+:H+ antiporter subunit F [Alkalibacillus salilacus]
MLNEFGNQFLDIALWISFVGVTLSIVLLVYRTIKGPTNPDRAVALDAIGVNMMALVGLQAINLGTDRLNDVILLSGILLFIGTIAIAKFLEKGVIIDRDHR